MGRAATEHRIALPAWKPNAKVKSSPASPPCLSLRASFILLVWCGFFGSCMLAQQECQQSQFATALLCACLSGCRDSATRSCQAQVLSETTWPMGHLPSAAHPIQLSRHANALNVLAVGFLKQSHLRVYTTSAVFQFIVPSMQYLKIVAVSLCWRVPERMMASAQLKGLLTSMGNDNTCRGGQTASANDSGVCVTQCAAAMQNPTSCPCASHQAHGSEGRKAALLQTGTLSKGSSGTRVEEGKENILQPDLWGFVVEGNNGKLSQWCKHIAVVQTFCWQGCFI